jgi:hypothetical protein
MYLLVTSPTCKHVHVLCVHTWRVETCKSLTFVTIKQLLRIPESHVLAFRLYYAMTSNSPLARAPNARNLSEKRNGKVKWESKDLCKSSLLEKQQ